MTATRVVVGDITRLDEVGVRADAVVNAANEGLRAGAGVCGAIFAAAGHGPLTAACQQVGGCPTGSAVSTPAFDLEARGVHHIVHAVGPVYGGQTPEESDRLLTSTYQAVLAEAERLGVERVAIPAISTGVFGFPERRAAAIAARTALAHDGALGEVVLVAFDPGTADVLRDAVEDARAG